MAIWSFFFKMATGRHLGFDPTGNGAVRSAVLKNPTLEPNTKSIGWHVAELWPFEFFHTLAGERTPDIGGCVWFYILSNAAKQCIGQTKSPMYATAAVCSIHVLMHTHARYVCTSEVANSAHTTNSGHCANISHKGNWHSLKTIFSLIKIER